MQNDAYPDANHSDQGNEEPEEGISRADKKFILMEIVDHGLGSWPAPQQPSCNCVSSADRH